MISSSVIATPKGFYRLRRVKKSLDKFPQITANGTSGGVPDEKQIRTDFPKPFNNRIAPR
jgi:hypothetical protein